MPSTRPDIVADPASWSVRCSTDVEGLRIEDVDAFASFIVVSYRRGGFARVGIIELAHNTLGDTESPFGPLQELPFSRETGTLGFAGNPGVLTDEHPSALHLHVHARCDLSAQRGRRY